MKTTKNRREFLKDAAVLGAAAAGVRAAEGWAAEEKPGRMPKIKLGRLEVSRLILGSNPFFGFAHGNPQASEREMRAYFTDERIMAVLDEAARHGVTAVWSPCYERWIRVWNEYRGRGGKLKIWIAQPDRLPMEKEITAAAKNGSKAVCIQGCKIDDQAGKGRFDVIRGWLELIKSYGLPAGMATHRANTHLLAEEEGLPTDFYHQTLYRPDNYVKQGLEESLATIEKLEKPVIGYKALGAGRIRPQDTFPYLFSRLKRKDGLCVGVFPKDNPDQIAENVARVPADRRTPA